MLRSRRRWTIAATSIALVIAGWAAATLVMRERHESAERRRIQAEAIEYAQNSGASMEAALAVCEMCMPPEQLARLSPKQLEHYLNWYRDFEGEDRQRVARYCVGLLVSDVVPDGFDAERLEIAGRAITEIIEEYWDDPQLIGITFAVARRLDLQDDPYLIELANATITQPDMPPNVCEFVAKVFFDHSGGSGQGGG